MKRIGEIVAQIARTLLDLVAALLGIYYSAKYAAVVRRLGLPRLAAGNKRRGFLVIQIDGLSHPALVAALERGYAPYLQRLLRREGYVLDPWHPGLPCTTPAVQAGIMFGNNEDIPAFRWYDKSSGEAIVCKVPRVVKEIQERVGAGRRGILRGGSSIMNMFDGHAALSLFTLSAMDRQRFFEHVRGMGFLLLFGLNPLRTLKMLLLILWEYVTELVQGTLKKLKRETPRPLERGFTFLRIMSNVVLREIQTFAVMVDLYRGVPAIYTTYYGYDELAHHYGVLSRPALKALRAIDRCIRRIDRLRQLALTREYDLYVLSDHGMTAAVPLAQAHGQTLGALLRELAGAKAAVNEAFGNERQGALQTVYLLDELAAIEANLNPPLAYIPRKLRQLVAKRIRLNGEENLGWDLARQTDVVARYSGSLAHIYFNVSPKQLSVSEIATLYPNLLSDLAAHPGVWLVVGREDEQVLVLSRRGVLTLDGEDGYHVEGEDPLALVPHPRLTAAELRRVARFSQSGDLIVLGHYEPGTDRVISFEPMWGCHGGLGGPQEEAFLLQDGRIRWEMHRITRATQLYELFARRYALGD